MKVLSYYPTTIGIDDPATGLMEQIKIKIRRFTLPEWSKWSRDYFRTGNPPSAVIVSRNDSPEEQATVDLPLKEGAPEGTPPQKAYVISDEDIVTRRLSEMNPEERAAYDQMTEAEEVFSNAFLSETVTKYVTVDAEQIYEEVDGVDVSVTTGEQMLRLYGGRQDVLAQLLRAVRIENTLPSPLKKVLQSRTASARSSAERPVAPVGATPEPTAGSAAPEGSAEIVGASPVPPQ